MKTRGLKGQTARILCGLIHESTSLGMCVFAIHIAFLPQSVSSRAEAGLTVRIEVSSSEKWIDFRIMASWTGARDTKQDPVGFPDTKPVLCPPFLDYRKWASFSLHYLSWVPTSRFKLLLTREGWMQRQRRSNSPALGQSLGSPSRDTHNIFEPFCRYWNPYQVGEINGMLPTSM